MNQDRDATSGEPIQDRFTSMITLSAPTTLTRNYTASGPVALADATSTRVGTTTVAIDVADSFTISDLNVVLSIDHTYVSDLRIRLIAPDGTGVTLISRRGNSSDNVRVTLDDEATASVSAATRLSGTFRPERLLSAFDGKTAAGRWTLEIVDVAPVDNGTFNSVQLQFTGTAATAATSGSSNNNSSSSGAASSIAGWLSGSDRYGAANDATLTEDCQA